MDVSSHRGAQGQGVSINRMASRMGQLHWEAGMELQGEQVISAARGRVWAALNDPAVLIKCIPGCEAIDKVTETETHVRLLAKIGPVRAHFSGKILMSEIHAPARCTLSFEGSGGAAGMAKGKSVVTLLEQGDSTCLRYTVQASVGGKLGQIGGRLIDASAKKMADDFFLAFNEQLSSQEEDKSFPAVSAIPLFDAGSEAGAAPASVEAVCSAPRQMSSTAAGGLADELNRVLWLSIGLGIGGLIGHLWHL